LATKKKPATTTKKKSTASTAKKSTATAKKKPAAKKSTTAAKKKSTTAAKKKPAAKKSTTAAKKSTTAAKKEPAAAKPVIPFAVGDKVVYPHHGAATIIKKQKLDVGGEKRDYFILEIATDQLTVSVPADSAVELGVRPVISRNKARQVFSTLRSEPQEAGSNWSRWYKVLTEKINSGDIFQVAEVIRDLDYAQKIKGISPALKRMLAKARLIIISELQFSLNISEEEAIKKLERALPKVEELAEV
jgi:CarD family transcriptional regulator